MNRGGSRLLHTSGWIYDDLPNVRLEMSGPISVKTDDDFEDYKMNDQFFNWRIDEEDDEFVIRFSRKPEAPSHGHINVDVKIERGLSTQPDGRDLLDGGLGKREGNKVSKFSLSFEISHESPPGSDSQEEWEQPEEHEIKFFHHREHKLLLAPENYYKDVIMMKASCDACTEPIKTGNARWVYECPNNCNYCVHAKCARQVCAAGEDHPTPEPPETQPPALQTSTRKFHNMRCVQEDHLAWVVLQLCEV